MARSSKKRGFSSRIRARRVSGNSVAGMRHRRAVTTVQEQRMTATPRRPRCSDTQPSPNPRNHRASDRRICQPLANRRGKNRSDRRPFAEQSRVGIEVSCSQMSSRSPERNPAQHEADRIIGLQHRKHLLDIGRQQQIIGIEATDVFTASGCDAAIACCPEGIRRANNPHPRQEGEYL